MLYIVATPIGNLQDITLRALETLKKVDFIYAEDTRRTKQLLTAFEIHKPVISLHHHSPESILEEVRCGVEDGKEIAYVTDAGTPGIQDPGGKLVEKLRDSIGYEFITPIPGPSSVTALLSVAGIAADKFSFMGFVPTKKGRETFIRKILAETEPVVFFETAPRFLKLLDQLIALGGEKRVLIVGRELTKKFEQIQFGLPEELKKDFLEPRGEFVLVLCP
ncbi:16S rRNA (cytidine(1402)-2'-O)-methyltransferase [Candidatus Berkelbacteria bacterium RIFCSPLOWO2_01_FULL_50_28]|uniref:Ribosomal RNA small subunit methyltransferase I n=1 Tax=Candidatus Berkelbacteria bacterium RIFCSPLOWO2_01_FULL_50_28 TaxID=1797471 RepID=A0A1F5EBJ9_9BACT|nr:MAG: 16S rRNA (cytidine(1402)-2'-O)-methyltransferase [Candidatus Berkelbacteria bacterium RIFCSPHIGHO2_01_FULL_50_36]OGD63460.1 MAG: 16S rRNA (cytidine(1402)-2'-O)-methyltransferase [Candidatus Berkelbacteria bacterium RIFCSPHIGHO2_12_FULL_50_11]OGD64670.1 MAG: 16S rRNA (cytidine(1402)-2'-O)-methyltransferase [Candidatus Berkelbacteria bacterium RIFCSPLOWO2_01_FULL_50_28]